MTKTTKPIPANATLEQRLVKCGKKTCRCARGGMLHGPYWFAAWKEGGRMRNRYVGAKITKEQFAEKRRRARERLSKRARPTIPRAS